jgi:hypothetical protein
LSDVSADLLRELLAQSLRAWRLSGSVRRTDDGSILLSSTAREIGIERAAPPSPFRWMVTIDGRRRGAISLVAVLRQVRSALDPAYAGSRVRVAAFPLVPS